VSAGSFHEIDAERPFPGIVRRAFSTPEATVTEYRFEPHSTFPEHFHPQEQITLILEGEAQLTAAGETATLVPGDWSVVPGGIPHGITSGSHGARFLAVLVPRRDPDAAYTLSERSDARAPGTME
jgi:quercetin dioxygenase-like cupin family protein